MPDAEQTIKPMQTCEHPQKVAGCEYCYPSYGDQVDMPRLEKADKRVKYGPADSGATEICRLCRYYQFGECSIVEGTIDATAVCSLFTALPASPMMIYAEVAEVAASGHTWQLFTDAAQAFADGAAAPDWIPFLPTPGIYSHPSYGLIQLSPERNAHFVEIFNSGTYQSKVPVDGEHETKVSGALAWITSLRQNENGSVDAQVEWTERGAAMVAEKRFAYVSPEWYEEWSDPATGTTYQDVAIGAALTTRPFFKEPYLRPLVASDRGLFAAEPVSPPAGPSTAASSPRPASEPIVLAACQRESVVSASETKTPATAVETVDPQAFTEAQRQLAEANAKIAASEKMIADQAALLEKSNERIQAQEDAAATRRFTDIVMGHGGEHDGQRWFGDVPAHVGHLGLLAKQFGEDSEPVKHYIALNQTHAAQLKAAGTFSEVGSAAASTQDTGALAEITAKAATLRASDPTMTEAKAIQLVLAADLGLKRRYAEES